MPSCRDPNEMTVGDGNPGPTADGRRKPDIVTPGCAITSAISGHGLRSADLARFAERLRHELGDAGGGGDDGAHPPVLHAKAGIRPARRGRRMR